MVAGDGDTVTHPVHQVDDGFPLGDGTDGFAPDAVPFVNKNDLVPLRQQILPYLLQTGVAKALVDATVDVAGVKDHNIPVPFDGLLRRDR